MDAVLGGLHADDYLYPPGAPKCQCKNLYKREFDIYLVFFLQPWLTMAAGRTSVSQPDLLYYAV